MQGKVALYTIFRCTNYGAVLQAYALARTLRAICGEDAVDVLNHRMDPRDNHLLGKITNPNTPWFQRWRNRRKFEARYVRPDLFEERRRKTIRLIEGDIRPTDRLYRSPDEFSGLPPYATVVVGSDQVWNPALNHDFGCNQYLAAHLPEGQDRVAYAASFGVAELPPELEAEYRAALSRFRAITVREESGAEMVRRLLPHRDTPRVALDPTLLLSPEEWTALGECKMENVKCKMKGTNQGARSATLHFTLYTLHSFIAAYWVRTVMQGDVDALAAVARRHGMPAVLMSAGPLPKLSFPDEVRPYVDADPFDFVRTVADSSGLVTDSFHGLQFASLFGRPLIALGDLGMAGSNASRLVDFCTRYGIADGVHDISTFRSVGDFGLSGMSPFRKDRLAADRAASLDALKSMLP